MLSLLSISRSLRSTRLRGWAFGSYLSLLALLSDAPTASAQVAYSTADAAYSAGVTFINDGNLAAAREPLEAALKMAKTDAYRLKVNRTLLIPYRELQEIEPMQTATEYILTNSEQAAERSLSRRALLSFIHRRGKMDVALKEYVERAKKTPEDWALLYVLTDAYATYKKDPAKSVEYGEMLIAAEKKQGKKQDLPELALLAQQYVKAEQPKEAAALFETIAPLDKKLEAWHLKEAATAWLKAGDKTKAVDAAKKSTAATPEKRDALLAYFYHRGVGDVFLDSGEPALAIPQYKLAIKVCTIAGYLKDTKLKLLEAEDAAKK